MRVGKIEASDAADATAQLTAQHITPLKIVRSSELVMPWENRPPSLKDRALFTQQFAQMIGGGVPQSEALAVAARSTTNRTLRAATTQIRTEILGGEKIQEVFARKEYARSFDPVFIAFIEMGTASGNIARPLKELGEMYKWQLRILGMVKKGLTLPAIITLACVVVTYFIMARVVPTFMGILTGLGAELPPLTRAVQAVSNVASNPVFTLGLIAAVVAAVLAVTQYRKTEGGRLKLDGLVLRLPVFGPLLKMFILARLSRSLSVMMSNSIPLDAALKIAGSVAANEVYRRHLLDMQRAVEDGTPMGPVLAQHPREFPEQFSLQFRAAEEKANLKETLKYLGEVYNDEVTSAVESLTSTIEPLLMVVLGGVVGVIVISVFLPMTTMMNALQK